MTAARAPPRASVTSAVNLPLALGGRGFPWASRPRMAQEASPPATTSEPQTRSDVTGDGAPGSTVSVAVAGSGVGPKVTVTTWAAPASVGVQAMTGVILPVAGSTDIEGVALRAGTPPTATPRSPLNSVHRLPNASWAATRHVTTEPTLTSASQLTVVTRGSSTDGATENVTG